MKWLVVWLLWLLTNVIAIAQPPAQAVNAGFTQLIFGDEFTGPLDIGFGTDGHKWNSNLWWKPVAPPSAYTVQSGAVTIIGTCEGTDLCTQYHDHTGGTYFKGGYFEAQLWCTDWSSFWLFCADRPTVWGNLVQQSNPMSWTNELDIIETDPRTFNVAVCTLHSNSSGDGGVPDQINSPNNFPLSANLIASWHTYGVLWTQTEVSWYVDNVKVGTTAPFASTWQPAQLVISSGPGGVNGSPSTVLPPVTKVRWVRVWGP